MGIHAVHLLDTLGYSAVAAGTPCMLPWLGCWQCRAKTGRTNCVTTTLRSQHTLMSDYVIVACLSSRAVLVSLHVPKYSLCRHTHPHVVVSMHEYACIPCVNLLVV